MVVLRKKAESQMGRGGETNEENACSTSQFHVVAVDDNFVERKLIEKMLKRNSFRVTTFDSAIKALDFLAQQPHHSHHNEVNMIFTDYCMPGMTGYDLLRKVKESSELSHIPVVVMSSEEIESRIESCRSEGAEEFLLKPVKASDVERVISNVVDNARQIAEATHANANVQLLMI